MLINLQHLETIILHNPTNVTRREKLDTLLSKLGFNYRFVKAINNEGAIRSGAKTLAGIFSELLIRDEFKPVIILEDDVNITPWYTSTEVNVPDDADGYYLGVSICSARSNQELYQYGVPWEDTTDTSCVKIQNMLSMHAYIITSKRWLIHLLRCMMIGTIAGTHFDIPVARNMHKYNIYSLRKPMFYQDKSVGGQQEPTLVTFDNIPKLAFVLSEPSTCIQYEPPSHVMNENPSEPFL